MRRMRALLADLDGTIADTHGLIWDCLRETCLAELEHDPDKSLFLARTGLPLAQIFEAILESSGQEGAPTLPLVEAYRIRLRAMDSQVVAYPGAEAALLALRDQGVRLAVVTSKLHATAERHLNTMGLAYLFEAIIGADDCVNLKPHPEPFLCGLAALKLAPEGVVGVGDTPHDIASARGAGLLAAGAGWGAQDPALLRAAQPDFLLDAPSHLVNLPELVAKFRQS